MLKFLKVAAVAATLAVTLSSCTKVVTQADVEDQIVKLTTLTDGSHPDSATCPGDLDATKGATMTCTIAKDGDSAKVKVTVTKVDGSDVNFDIEPA